MRTKMRPLVAFLTAILATLGSCELLNDFDMESLADNQFYAQDMVTGDYYKLTAEKLYEGETCVIWAEEGSGVTWNVAMDIASEYDSKIRGMMIEKFSVEGDIRLVDNNQLVVYRCNNILDLADWLTDEDGKLTILLLDIRDGHSPPQKDSYVAGYFFSGNFWPKGRFTAAGGTHYSNAKDMIYVDTSPGLDKQKNQAYATFAHELQHLINWVTSCFFRGNLMETWIDEGLSSQAEYFYLGGNLPERYNWFSNDRLGTIERGNNFFVWGNHEPDAILDDYATVYLFFRWLYLQADANLKQDIFKKISASPNYHYEAVTEVARDINNDWSDWEPLLRTWLAANYYPGNTVYGYKGDTYLQGKIKARYTTGSSIQLYPGEGVYSVLGSSFTPSAGGGKNIRYAGLSGSSSAIDIDSPYAGNILLTFNANPNKDGAREIGRLATPVEAVPFSVSASVSVPIILTLGEDNPAERFNGLYVLDARDVLGRNRETEMSGAFLRPPYQLMVEQ